MDTLDVGGTVIMTADHPEDHRQGCRREEKKERERKR